MLLDGPVPDTVGCEVPVVLGLLSICWLIRPGPGASGVQGVLRQLTCSVWGCVSTWLAAWPEVSQYQYRKAGKKTTTLGKRNNL